MKGLLGMYIHVNFDTGAGVDSSLWLPSVGANVKHFLLRSRRPFIEQVLSRVRWIETAAEYVFKLRLRSKYANTLVLRHVR
jgi:hypothetical protein